jgi:hypothetical protein
MYKLSPVMYGQTQSTSVLNLDNGTCIPFDPDNTDYEIFKSQINDETATLETADGVVMTPEEAKAYVATLP